MGTDGRPRPANVRISTLPEHANNSGSRWLASSISPEPEELQETAWKEPEELHDASFDISQLKQNGQKTLISERDSVGLVQFPGRDHHGNAQDDTTSQMQAAEPVQSHSSPTSHDEADDLSPFRQVSQDSAYESIMDVESLKLKADVDLQAANIRARGRVETARLRVLQTRRIISEKRQEVQWLRERLRDATDRLMREVNELMSMQKVETLGSLIPYHEALRKVQDDLGPAENAYDLLEIRLNREEEDLEREEMQFYTRNNIALNPSDEALNQALTPHVVPYGPEEPVNSIPNHEHELIQMYLSKVSEAGALKEQLRELDSEQYELTEELSFRQRYNLSLSKEKSVFLFEYPQLRRVLINTLEEIEDTLFELRHRCIQENLFSETEYLYEPYDAFVEDIYDSINDVRDQRPLHAQYTRHHVDFVRRQDYVNKWLLEWMHESTLQTMLLKSFIYSRYPNNGRQLLGDDWSGLALEFWDQDSVEKGADGDGGLSTIDALLGGTGSSLELEDWGFGPGPILVSRSLSSQKGGREVGIQLRHVERVHLGQGPIRRRRRASNSRARSL